MNLTVVDATDVEGVRVGDPVLLFGQLGKDLLRVEDLANWAGALPHEILCNVGQAVPRTVVSS
jgi:alanine racemase